MRKYLVVPGRVQSKTDGDIHFIPAHKLMHLFCVQEKDCEIMGLGGNYSHRREAYIVLEPKYDGDYPLFGSGQPPQTQNDV